MTESRYLEDDLLRRQAKCTARSPTLIELVPVIIDYDLTVEEMMADYHPFEYMMEECAERPIGYATDYFPGCKEERTGQHMRELLLFRPATVDKYWDPSQIRTAIEEAGYVAEELPSLVALFPFADSLWRLFGHRVSFIYAVGLHSIWQRPDGSPIGTFLYPGDGETHPWNWNWTRDQSGDGQSDDWFVVSR